MTKEKMTAEELQTALMHFTGTEQWYRVSLTGIVTDGVKFLCDKAECYWLIDVITSYYPRMKIGSFAMVKLTVNQETGEGKFIMVDSFDDDGKTYNYCYAKQTIPFTDFPLPEINLYIEKGIICLPSER